MNHSITRYIMGRVYGVFAMLLSLPLFISFLYQESGRHQLAWLIAILLSLVLFFFVWA